MAQKALSLKVNGQPVVADVEPAKLLLDFLRDDLGLTGTKEGCGTGDCGACTVHFNGKPVHSCLTLAIEATAPTSPPIEGLAPADGLHPVQAAFVEYGGTQCGFCIPGFMMIGAALARGAPAPDRGRAAHGHRRQPLPLHRLRQDRARAPGRRRRQGAGADQAWRADGDPAAARARRRVVECPKSSIARRSAAAGLQGHRHSRCRASTASRRSPARPSSWPTTTLPGMLLARALRSPHAHARITRLDTLEGRGLPRRRRGRDRRRHRDSSASRPRARRHRRHDPGAVRRAAGRGRRGADQRDRRRGARADRGRVRGAAAGPRPARGDEERRAGDHARGLRGRDPHRPQRGEDPRRRRRQPRRGGGDRGAEQRLLAGPLQARRRRAGLQGGRRGRRGRAGSRRRSTRATWSRTRTVAHWDAAGNVRDLVLDPGAVQRPRLDRAHVQDPDLEGQRRRRPRSAAGSAPSSAALAPLAVLLSRKARPPGQVVYSRSEDLVGATPAPHTVIDVKLGREEGRHDHGDEGAGRHGHRRLPRRADVDRHDPDRRLLQGRRTSSSTATRC